MGDFYSEHKCGECGFYTKLHIYYGFFVLPLQLAAALYTVREATPAQLAVETAVLYALSYLYLYVDKKCQLGCEGCGAHFIVAVIAALMGLSWIFIFAVLTMFAALAATCTTKTTPGPTLTCRVGDGLYLALSHLLFLVYVAATAALLPDDAVVKAAGAYPAVWAIHLFRKAARDAFYYICCIEAALWATLAYTMVLSLVWFPYSYLYLATALAAATALRGLKRCNNGYIPTWRHTT